MLKTLALVATIVGGLVVKAVFVEVTVEWLTWTWAGLAETVMGHRSVLEGAGNALAAVLGMIAGSIIGTAVLTAFADPRRRLSAIALTAVVYAVAFGSAIGWWLHDDRDLKIGGRLIAQDSYLKWPPLQSAWLLDDRLSAVMLRAAPADLVLIAVIVLWPARRARGLSRAGTSPAAS